MLFRLVLIIVFVSISLGVHAQKLTVPFEQSKGARVAQYSLLLDTYVGLAASSNKLKLESVGPTDSDYPLSVMYYSGDGNFNTEVWKNTGKIRILINNGIHPGEYDGIDASMLLLKDIVNGKVKVPENVVLAIIPSFNIYGTINLRKHSRANQNGPLVTGFRGNGQNLDLNRDFIKMDAYNTQTMVKLFHDLDPDILLDNHVSNGADYQHIMTLLSTQHSKLGGPMGKYLKQKFEPKVYASMKKEGYDLVPYVNVWGTTPDNGWQAFSETPRFFSGYAALFNTYAFVAETHMLKPYVDRVDATYELMVSMINIASEISNDIRATRKQQRDWIAGTTSLAIDWEVDSTQNIMIDFKGYESGTKLSQVSGKPRLYYDRDKPYTKQVPFYDYYKPSQTADVPKAYVVLHGWHNVIDRLKMNGVQVRKLQRDSLIDADVTYIEDYQTVKSPYEGHYLHSNVRTRVESQKIFLRKGDYIISTDQPAKRYIVETLEPTAPDAFFAWGFFDAVLQKKEHYSAYVFEDLAAEMLEKDADLKVAFEGQKQDLPDFENDGDAQLNFIYMSSDYHEPEHMRYPVFRLK